MGSIVSQIGPVERSIGKPASAGLGTGLGVGGTLSMILSSGKIGSRLGPWGAAGGAVVGGLGAGARKYAKTKREGEMAQYGWDITPITAGIRQRVSSGEGLEPSVIQEFAKSAKIATSMLDDIRGNQGF